MTSSSYHHDGKQVESALSDDEEEEYASESSVLNGQPFSALTPSMRSQELLSTDFMAETKSGPNDYIFDEFGFKVEGADLPEKRSKILSTPFVEDSKHKLKWIAFLEFNCNTDLKELTFDQLFEYFAEVVSAASEEANIINKFEDMIRLKKVTRSE